MSKIEKLEKELDFLKEKYRGYFLILLGLLTGEATIIYAVVTGVKPLYTLILAVVGLIFLAILTNKITSIEEEIYVKLKELEEE
ncbi:hypothetical protein MNB_SM-5-466 [hydrothermal vent metagenome]|uniref:Uncharacterized protein n=1 Tax=hydrothermal vent metagenome TaxID=652676 RepID=A0A1W1CYL7_9ZZZZ